MNKKIIFVIIVLFFVIGMASLVPTLLSSDWTRQSLLERINKEGQGILAVQNCSIGWRTELVCQQIDYTTSKLHVQIPELTIDQGLLAYIVNPRHLGTVTLNQPHVTLAASLATHAQKAALQEQSSQIDKGVSKINKRFQNPKSSLWDKLVAHLVIRDAVFLATLPEKKAIQLIKNVTAEAKLVSGSVEFELDGQAANDTGDVLVKGFVNLPIRETGMLETFISETRVQLTDLELAPFGEIVSKSLNMSDFGGRVSGSGIVKTSGLETFQAKGSLILGGFHAAGGFLGSDHPQLKKVEISLDLSKDSSRGVQIPSLSMISDFATINLTGAYKGNKSSLKGTGVVELPALFRQLPQLSHLDPTTRLDTGTLDMSFDLLQEDTNVALTTETRVAGFSGMQGKRPFSWDTPVKFSLSGTQNPAAGITVQKAMLTAPFLQCSGKGNLDNFFLQGRADLELASKELGKIFALDWQGSGKLSIEAKSEKKGDERYRVTADISLPDLVLSYHGETVLPRQPFSVRAQLETSAIMPASKADAMQLHVALSSWPGTINGDFTAIHTKKDKLLFDYTNTSTLKLGRLTEIGHTLDLLPRKTTLTGILNFESEGSVRAKQIIARRFEGVVEKLVLHSDGIIFRDDLVRINATVPAAQDRTLKKDSADQAAVRTKKFAADSGYTFIDLQQRQLALHGVKLVTGKEKVELQQLVINDWNEFPSSLRVLASGSAEDLASLSPVLQQLKILPAERALGGKGTFVFDLAGAGGNMQVDIQQPVLFKKGKKVFRDHSLVASSRFTGNLFHGDVQLDPVQLSLPALQVKATGKLQRTGKQPYFLLQGTISPKVEQLARAFSPGKDIGFSVLGEQKEEFVVKIPMESSGRKGIENLFLKTALHAKKISSAGFVMEEISMPLTLKKGVASAQLKAVLYESLLALKPKVDFTVTPPLLTLPPKSQLLTKAKLARPLVDGLLKRIHPLLGQLARPKGTISANIEQFFLPLTGKGIEKADFHLVFDTSRLTLAADGILREILTIAGYDDDIIALKQSKIDCYGKQGTVECTPLHILAADSEMVLAGSVGLDGSLDYILEIPITKGLVGKEGFRILEGATLRVPIKGNSEKAVFDAELLRASMKSLLTQAAGNEVKKQIKKILPDLLDKFLGK